MCSDGLAFAVRVRRQIDGVYRKGQLLELGENFLFAGNNNVFGIEVVLGIHTERALGKVLDVAVRGLDREVFTQILLNSFRLARRFDND